MLHYITRRSTFEATYGLHPEDELDFYTVHAKVSIRREIRFKKRLRVEAARRALQHLMSSDAYRHVPRGSKRFNLEQLRINARKSK